jgi:hypothetical protein
MFHRVAGWSTWLCLGAALLTALACATTARADSSRRAVVLRPHMDKTERDASLNRKLLDALEQMAVVELLPQPALDLESAQLALDCMEQNARCLREVAEHAKADVLIAPMVTRADGKTELTLLYFDAQSDEAPHKVVRRQRGDELTSATLDAIPAMLRELFGSEETTAEPEHDAEHGEPAAPAKEPAAASSSKHIPLGAVLLGGVGVVGIGSGIALGVMMRDTQHKYSALAVQTPAQADAAERQRKQGQGQALGANLLLGAGIAALAASGIWLAISLTREDHPDEQRAALVPLLGSDRAGLVLAGELEARR